MPSNKPGLYDHSAVGNGYLGDPLLKPFFDRKKTAAKASKTKIIRAAIELEPKTNNEITANAINAIAGQ
jgi:hypothetical protein